MIGIASFVHRRRWLVIAVALVFFGLAVVVGGPLTGELKAGGFQDPDAEFVAAAERIEVASGATPEASVIALVETPTGARSPAGRAEIARVADALAADEAVAQVVSAFNGGGAALIADDGRSSYLVASFAPISDDAADEAAARIQDELGGAEGVRLGGVQVVNEQAGAVIEDDLARAEMLAFPIILMLSLWIFRGLVAALLPALMGAFVIFGGFLGLGLLNQATDLSLFALNLVIGLGLGLAIDYSLLIVSRFREEIGVHGPGRAALARTLATAGRSVLFSAVTVAAALAGLMVFPQNFLFSMGVGGVIVALVAAVAALVVLPGVLALLGARVNALAPRAWRRRSERSHEAVRSGAWYRLSGIVMRRPGLVATATAGLLIIVALPALGIRFTTPDADILPTSTSARQVSDTLESSFPQDRSTPVTLAVSAPDDGAARAALAGYARELEALPGAAAVVPPQPVGPGTWRIDVVPGAGPLDAPTKGLVQEIRAGEPPYPTLVGGQTAGFLDQQDSISAHLPLAVLVVAGVTVVALFMMTGSVVLPVKAVLMNVLTLGATLGLLVFVFQEGRLEGLLGYDSRGALDLTQPILLGAVAFGLSTDYAVFLLSRIKEALEAGASDGEAVAIGLQRTGRVVTAAALLFAVAIGAFATSQIVLIKELGVGTALAVLIDATIIRALLVPSLMGLLGRWNWWAPRPLRRLHDRFGWSEGEARPA